MESNPGPLRDWMKILKVDFTHSRSNSLTVDGGMCTGNSASLSLEGLCLGECLLPDFDGRNAERIYRINIDIFVVSNLIENSEQETV